MITYVIMLYKSQNKNKINFVQYLMLYVNAGLDTLDWVAN